MITDARGFAVTFIFLLSSREAAPGHHYGPETSILFSLALALRRLLRKKKKNLLLLDFPRRVNDHVLNIKNVKPGV